HHHSLLVRDASSGHAVARRCSACGYSAIKAVRRCWPPTAESFCRNVSTSMYQVQCEGNPRDETVTRRSRLAQLLHWAAASKIISARPTACDSRGAAIAGRAGPARQGSLGERRGQAGERGREGVRSEEHTSELQSLRHLVCRLLLEKKK